MRRIAFKALDNEIVAFDVPRGVNHRLALKAIQRVHESGDAAIPAFLTKAETEFVAQVIAELEAHRPKTEADAAIWDDRVVVVTEKGEKFASDDGVTWKAIR